MLESVTIAAEAPQRFECTNCTDYTAFVGVALAAAALVISAYSLYLGALRRPRIQIDYVSHEQELAFPSWRGASPVRGPHLTLKLVVANTGASGTYVEQLQLSGDYSAHGAKPFGRLDPQGHVAPAGLSSSGPGVALPIAFDRGEVQPYELSGHFALLNPEDTKTLASDLHSLDWLEFEVVCWYRRPDFFRPSTRRTVRVVEKIRLDCETLKRSAESYWASQEAYAEEARILTAGS